MYSVKEFVELLQYNILNSSKSMVMAKAYLSTIKRTQKIENMSTVHLFKSYRNFIFYFLCYLEGEIIMTKLDEYCYSKMPIVEI